MPIYNKENRPQSDNFLITRVAKALTNLMI